MILKNLACAVVWLSNTNKRIEVSWKDGLKRKGVTWQKCVDYVFSAPLIAILFPVALSIEGGRRLMAWAKRNCKEEHGS